MPCAQLDKLLWWLIGSLVPSPLSAFFTCRKKTREGLGSKVTWQMLAKWRCASLAAKRRLQTCLASLVDQTKLCEASKDRTTLADSQCSLLFHPHWTRELENRARPRAIFTIRHPSYPSIWAYVAHVTLDPRLPLFSRVRWKDRGAWGRG